MTNSALSSVSDGLFSAVGTVVEGSDPSVFNATHRSDVAMTIWRRRLDSGLSAWIDGLTPDRLPDRRIAAPRSAVPKIIAAACENLPEGAERTALIDNIVEVVLGFCDIAHSPRVKIRLQAVANDGCRRFHQDAVAARLLCTYRGPATEWGYAERGEAPKHVQKLLRGDVAILKGARSKSGVAHNVVHRSPPIEGTGEARLLLVVDPIDWSDSDDIDRAWAGDAGGREI